MKPGEGRGSHGEPRELVADVAAREDLLEIWLFSEVRWGSDQADQYLSEIETRVNGLILDPTEGMPADELVRGYWFVAVGRHLVFYTFDDRTVRVRRVLHRVMEHRRHLP